MKDKIPKIKEELERRYKLCDKTTFNGFLKFAYNYFDFINKIPFLLTIIGDENKIIKQNKQAPDREIIFPMIYKAFSKKIENLSEENHPIKWPSRNYESRFRGSLIFIHDRLIGKLSEYELGVPQTSVMELNEEVKQLGLTDQSKWSDLEIVFIGDYDARIRYKDREYKTDYEKMGFKDERKKDKTSSIASWKLLQALAINDCRFQLGVVNKNEKDKILKQKQKLAKLLKNYFHVLGNPFQDFNKENKEYILKIKLVPDQIARTDFSGIRTRNYLKPVI